MWKEWIRENPSATQEQILKQLDQMKSDFGIR
jgi:hypothetical protein